MDDDVYNWPWLCAGEMGDWKLTDAQAAKLREFLLRGGFLMLDDFWGSEEWDRFNESMQRVFPDRPIVEIDSADAIFHTIYDLDDRYQIPGEWALARGTTYRNGEQGGQHRALAGHLRRSQSGDGGHLVTTPTSETHGNGRTIRAIPRNTLRWASASA